MSSIIAGGNGGGSSGGGVTPGGDGSITGLTAGRVPFALDADTLTDDADMTFATDTLTVTKALVPTSLGVALGGSTPATALQVASSSTSSPRGIMSSQHNDGTDGARLHLRKSRGTLASPTVVVTGDNLGRLVATGYDGSNYLEMASIVFGTEGTIASTRVPTNIQFWTATNAAPSVLTHRWDINSAGHLLPFSDNAYDIGASGATRPRTIYVGTSVMSSILQPAPGNSNTLVLKSNNSGGTATTALTLNADQSATFASATASTSTTTGALVVTGGVGVGGALYVGSGGITASSGTITGNIFVMTANQVITANGRWQLGSSPSNGVVGFYNAAGTDFGRLQFGGTTSSFPAIKRSTTVLQARLADDSAAATFEGKFNSSDSSAGVSAGPFTAITAITVKDGLVTAITGT